MMKLKLKYKVGDKLTIKKSNNYWKDIEAILQKTNRIVTVKKMVDIAGKNYYILEEVRAYWDDSDIEELAPELEPISRFDLMEFE